MLIKAFKYSIPVLLGYLAIGIAFGLLLIDGGYPFWLALFMSIVMYAGAGQYIAVGLFASGATIFEAIIVQFVVNARHIAYGITMLKPFNLSGKYKPYLIFALTDETFALLSSMPCIDENNKDAVKERSKFMFYVSVLDQFYWVLGTVIGAVAGTLISFKIDGIDFALTALFIVLMIEQIKRVQKALPFIISALCAVFTVIFIPARVSLLSALAISLLIYQFFDGRENK